MENCLDIDKNKIDLGLTVRGKDADRFWVSLFHEIGHILLGHHNQDGTSEEDELNADEFSKEQLIPSKQFKQFTARNSFEKANIVSFAKQIEIDPGIVVGRLQKEGYIEFSWHNDLKTRYTISL
jgi:HTH-type transcriptional regulator/antitoxin HigA